MSDTTINVTQPNLTVEVAQQNIIVSPVAQSVTVECTQPTVMISPTYPDVTIEISGGQQGPPGPTGAQGPAGVGVPSGGTAGQVLAKVDGVNYNTHWVNQSGGADGDGIYSHDGTIPSDRYVTIAAAKVLNFFLSTGSAFSIQNGPGNASMNVSEVAISFGIDQLGFLLDGGNQSVTFTGPNTTIQQSYSDLSFIVYDGGVLVVRDYRTTPVGMEYEADYSANAINNDRSIPDVYTVKILAQSVADTAKQDAVQWTTATRPTGANRKKGTHGYNLTANHMEYWNGTTWVQF